RVTPQVGEIEAEDPGAGNRGMSVKLLTAYDVLVTVRPTKPVSALVATRSAAGLMIRNTGNTNTLVFDGTACTAAAAKAETEVCEDLGARRMYPGNEWNI